MATLRTECLRSGHCSICRLLLPIGGTLKERSSRGNPYLHHLFTKCKAYLFQATQILPYRMFKDKIIDKDSQYLVKMQLNSEDRWTKAMKCLLLNLKRVVGIMINIRPTVNRKNNWTSPLSLRVFHRISYKIVWVLTSFAISCGLITHITYAIDWCDNADSIFEILRTDVVIRWNVYSTKLLSLHSSR